VGMMASFVDHLAEQLEGLQQSLAASEAKRAEMNVELTNAVKALSGGETGGTDLQLTKLIDGQEALIERLKDSAGEGMDAESRMRLRSIDVQMLRLLEELSSGRQETTASLRNEIAALTRAVTRSSQGGG